MLEFSQIQCMQDSVHVGELLRAGGIIALSKQGRELECFPDCGALIVNIHLLAVANSPVESLIDWVVIHVDRARQVARTLSLRQGSQYCE